MGIRRFDLRIYASYDDWMETGKRAQQRSLKWKN